MGTGANGFVGICFQTSFGTLLQNSVDYFPIVSENINIDYPEVLAQTIKGRFEEGDSYDGATSCKGDIVFEAHPIYLGKMLRAFCGVSSSTLVGSVYTHDFIPKATDFDEYSALQPMTIEVYRDASSSYLYYNMLCDAINIEIAQGGLMRCTMSVLGGKFQKSVKTTPTYLPGAAYTFDQASISIDAAAATEFSTISFKGSNSLENKFALNGSLYPARTKRNGNRTLEIAGTMLFSNNVEADKFLNSTLTRLIVNMAGMTLTGSQTAVFRMDVPKMMYMTFPANITGPGFVEVSWTAKAKFDETSSYLFKATMQNTRSAY